MSLEQFSAVLAGYNDKRVDDQIVAVMSGYYSGYYSNSKRAKKPNEIINKLTAQHKRETSTRYKKRKRKHTYDDVGAGIQEFQRREAAFKLRQLEVNNDG